MSRTTRRESDPPVSRGEGASASAQPGQPVVDVVVVSYNDRDLLRAACESAMVSDPLTRVMVVDNGSTDGSVDAIRDLIAPGDLLEMEENLGFGAAANRGIAAGDAPFVLLLNSDASLQAGSLEMLVAALQPPEVAAAGPRLTGSSGQVELSMGRTMGPLNEAAFKLLEVLYREGRGPLAGAVNRYYGESRWTRSLSAACLLLRREALSRVGAFDDRFFLYAEDVDLCRRLSRAGWRLRYVANATAHHERSVGLRARPEEVARAYRSSQMAFYRKHHGAFAARALQLYLACRFGLASVLARGQRRELARSMLRWTLEEAGRVR
jgi:GT2 family glycosyltransferase